MVTMNGLNAKLVAIVVARRNLYDSSILDIYRPVDGIGLVDMDNRICKDDSLRSMITYFVLLTRLSKNCTPDHQNSH